jgi:hypothetical protein
VSIKKALPLVAAAATLAVVSLAVSLGVAIHELSYASDHPYAYGPAKVIATGAGGAATLAAALLLLAIDLLRRER